MYTYIHTYIHIYVHIYVRMYIIMYEGGKFFSYVQFLVKKCVKNPGYPLFPTRVFLALPVPNPNTRVKPPFPTRPVPNVNSIYPFPSRPDPSTALIGSHAACEESEDIHTRMYTQMIIDM